MNSTNASANYLMTVRVMCSRCRSRAAATDKSYCRSCLQYFQARYDKRIGGASNLQKGRRARRMRKAA